MKGCIMFYRFIFILGLSLLPFEAVVGAEVRKLPQPDKNLELMQLLDKRHSSRSYSNKPVSEQTLSDLLWAAFGINQKGTRTVPTAMNKQNLNVYVVYQNSIWSYDAVANSLIKVSDEEIGDYIAKQDFVKDAPVNLIYTGSDKEFSSFHAGAAAQNVYLYATNKGLNTIVRAYIDKDELKNKLRLDREEFVIMNQVIGYPEK